MTQQVHDLAGRSSLQIRFHPDTRVLFPEQMDRIEKASRGSGLTPSVVPMVEDLYMPTGIVLLWNASMAGPVGDLRGDKLTFLVIDLRLA